MTKCEHPEDKHREIVKLSDDGTALNTRDRIIWCVVCGAYRYENVTNEGQIRIAHQWFEPTGDTEKAQPDSSPERSEQVRQSGSPIAGTNWAGWYQHVWEMYDHIQANERGARNRQLKPVAVIQRVSNRLNISTDEVKSILALRNEQPE